MYVCHCRGVTDGAIRGAIASGASSVEELARHCAAGSRCGGCWPALQRLLAESDRAGHCPAATHQAA